MPCWWMDGIGEGGGQAFFLGGGGTLCAANVFFPVLSVFVVVSYLQLFILTGKKYSYR